MQIARYEMQDNLVNQFTGQPVFQSFQNLHFLNIKPTIYTHKLKIKYQILTTIIAHQLSGGFGLILTRAVTGVMIT